MGKVREARVVDMKREAGPTPRTVLIVVLALVAFVWATGWGPLVRDYSGTVVGKVRERDDTYRLVLSDGSAPGVGAYLWTTCRVGDEAHIRLGFRAWGECYGR